jgi:hypothetical protein
LTDVTDVITVAQFHDAVSIGRSRQQPRDGCQSLLHLDNDES